MAGACSQETEYVPVMPDIPVEMLTPCPISARQVGTVNQLAAIALSWRGSAECANSKIEAIAKIVDPA